MAIEFHCEHCNHLIKAAPEIAGQTGKCPCCGVETYIPSPIEEENEELGLAPIDEEFEQHRKQAALEDAEYQRKLLKEKATPEEKAAQRRDKPSTAAPRGPDRPPSKQIVGLIVQYLEAMSGGQLERAAAVAKELAKDKTTTTTILDRMETEDLAGYGLSPLPRPVFLGFLKQLRSKL